MHREISDFFFFNDTATTEIYTLSLHDALPISSAGPRSTRSSRCCAAPRAPRTSRSRSEEHTSELQSLAYLVCRLLLEKKKTPLARHRTQRIFWCIAQHTPRFPPRSSLPASSGA